MSETKLVTAYEGMLSRMHEHAANVNKLLMDHHHRIVALEARLNSAEAPTSLLVTPEVRAALEKAGVL